MTQATEQFNAAVAAFIEGCTKISNDHREANYANLQPTVFKAQPGKRYVKIIRCDANGVGTSVHCFLDKTNGDVLKAASWKAPAKHARGNLFDEDNGLGSMGPYGPAYLR